MANKESLTERLLLRFRGVPNFKEEDAEAFIEESIEVNGNDSRDELVLIYAQSQAAQQVALSVSHYFKFSDGEESVDKSMVADNYRKIAKDLVAQYEAEIYKETGSGFKVMRRLDR